MYTPYVIRAMSTAFYESHFSKVTRRIIWYIFLYFLMIFVQKMTNFSFVHLCNTNFKISKEVSVNYHTFQLSFFFKRTKYYTHSEQNTRLCFGCSIYSIGCLFPGHPGHPEFFFREQSNSHS